jgi:16S rRNA processing protein RimM
MASERWSRMVTVGRVVRPQGNRGEVVIQPDTDFGADRFRPGERVETTRDESIVGLTVRSSREHDGRWIVGFEGVGSIGEAEALRGLELKIPADALRPLAADRHYVHDLVGCRVETLSHDVIGTIADVHLGAGTPLLVVEGSAGEVLVPFVDEFCKRIDVAARTVVIAPPNGLLGLNQKGSTDAS